jgi:hypothetical protein
MEASTHVGDATGSLNITSDRSAAEQSPVQNEPASITSNLLDWQATGEEACLERLWGIVSPIAHRMITATLHRLGIHDPSAVDETISLLLDHLRRLSESSTGDRAVARFAPRTDSRGNKHLADSGLAFIVWLSRERAAHVARALRRRNRKATVFSLLDPQTTNQMHAYAASSAYNPPKPSTR